MQNQRLWRCREDPKVTNLHWVAFDRLKIRRDNDRATVKNRTLTHNPQQPAQKAKPQLLQLWAPNIPDLIDYWQLPWSLPLIFATSKVGASGENQAHPIPQDRAQRLSSGFPTPTASIGSADALLGFLFPLSSFPPFCLPWSLPNTSDRAWRHCSDKLWIDSLCLLSFGGSLFPHLYVPSTVLGSRNHGEHGKKRALPLWDSHSFGTDRQEAKREIKLAL